MIEYSRYRINIKNKYYLVEGYNSGYWKTVKKPNKSGVFVSMDGAIGYLRAIVNKEESENV